MNPFAKTTIVVPIDFSEESDRAVDAALCIAERGANVHVLHVCPPLYLFEGAAVAAMSEDETHEQYIEAMRKRFAGDEYRDLHMDVRFGDACTQITSYAEQHNAGLIVLPSHGRTGLSHLLLGSVAERVVRLAPCPVLVLRGDAALAGRGYWKGARTSQPQAAAESAAEEPDAVAPLT
jgi:nucleotide-binding universal stress UspA family protein